jgi:hypothetical protein
MLSILCKCRLSLLEILFENVSMQPQRNNVTSFREISKTVHCECRYVHRCKRRELINVLEDKSDRKSTNFVAILNTSVEHTAEKDNIRQYVMLTQTFLSIECLQYSQLTSVNFENAISMNTLIIQC